MSNVGGADPAATKILMNSAAMALAYVTLREHWRDFATWMNGGETPPVTDEAMRQVFLTCRDRMNAAASGLPALPGKDKE
jgi:hypothetical protein